MSPVSGAPDDEHLRRYLLGSLPPEESERLDELSITDGDVAARLRAVEHDLVDAYVSGELSGDLLDRLRSHYLSSPANRSHVTFAATLHRYQQTAAQTPAHSFRSPWSAARWGLAAAAILALAAGYLLTDNIRLRSDVSRAAQAAAQAQERERQLQAQLTEARSVNADTSRELARARESATPPSTRTDSLRPSGAGVLAFTLRPATRGPDSVPAVVIPAATESLRLRLPLEMDDHPRYQAVLKNASGTTEVWRSGDLQSTADRSARILSVTIPARLVQAGFYTIEIGGVPASGSVEFLSSYPFRVVLQ